VKISGYFNHQNGGYGQLENSCILIEILYKPRAVSTEVSASVFKG
jgi:hypothetical protein